MAVAVEVKLSAKVTAKYLWEKTDNIMTDSVSKNIGNGKLIAKKLGSNHIPNHLLCNAHVVEKFDATNLVILADVEHKLKLHERLETVNPSLRPFFRGKKAVVLAGIHALLKLVTPDKSGNFVSLAEEFDDLLRRENCCETYDVMKLGYTAGYILCALPQLKTLLHETWKSNLIEACKLYVDCKLFIAELHILAVFTKKVTLPYLNCMEKLSQRELVKMFLLLYKDLLEHKMDTLKDYIVEYHHVPVAKVTNVCKKKRILERMCEEAAKGFDLQRGKEYGFGENHQQRETTDVHTMTAEEIGNIHVVHNLDCERLLATFSHRAVVAKFRNRTFTAQGICDDVVLAKSNQAIVEFTTRKISNILKKEEDWTAQQKNLLALSIQKKIAESKTACDYTQKLMKSCKTWGGPVATPNELEATISKHGVAEKIVKTELSYYCKTHERQRTNPSLFKILIPHEERLENLLVLLGGRTMIMLPRPLHRPLDELRSALGTILERKSLRVDEMCVVAWLEEKPRWYLGYVTKTVGG